MQTIPSLRTAAAAFALLATVTLARAQTTASPYAPQNNPPSPPSPYAPQNNPPPQPGAATNAIPIPKPPPVAGGVKPAAVPVQYEVPILEVNSIKAPQKNANERSFGIAGKVRFTHVPPASYLIECFFVCKSPIGTDRYIIKTEVFRKDGYEAQFQSTVPNFNGDDTAERVIIPAAQTSSNLSSFAKPVSKPEPTLAPGATPAPTPQLPQTPRGAKYEGWIVRVTADGQILRVDSNQPELATLARTQQDIFDTAAIHKMPPDPRRDTLPPN